MPYALCPIPYSLFPIPYSLFPIPYSHEYLQKPEKGYIKYQFKAGIAPSTGRTIAGLLVALG